MQLVRMKFKREQETIESQLAAKRHNAATEAVFSYRGRKFRVTIASGRSDDVTMFRTVPRKGENPAILILSVNRRMGYAGLQEFTREGDTYSEAGDVFHQSEEALRECVGPKGLEYTERTLTVRLFEYLPH